MVVRQELSQYLQQASRVEELDILPPNASFFQKKLAELVIWKLGEDWSASQIGFQAACQETFNRLLPLVDFLTQPRSIAEFQDLKRGLLEVICREEFESEDSERLGEIISWLDYLLHFGIKIFPYSEMESLSCGQEPRKIWKAYEEMGSRRFRQIEEKIITFEEAVVLAEQAHEAEEARVGYTIGKWRLGPHSEHARLFEKAKLALGMDGLLFVGVESQRSIWQRRGRDHFSLPDRERLEQIAALEAVDYAVLFDPSDEELKNPKKFYYQADRRLYRDIWFVGCQDYHWLPEFEERTRELGMILLWRSPTSRLSNTELIDQIQRASRK